MTAEQARWLVALIVLLCVLTAADIGAMVYIYRRAIHTGVRVEALLTMAEAHGRLTDATSGRVLTAVESVGQKAVSAAVAAAKTATAVKQAVEAVPGKTVEKLRELDPLDPNNRPG